jgi:hypothetical protein
MSSNDQSSTYCHLNDIAISLLEQNCFIQAFDTCYEALGDEASSEAVSAARERTENIEPFPGSPSLKYVSLSIGDLQSTSDGKKGLIDFAFEAIDTDPKQAKQCFLVIRCGQADISTELATAVLLYNNAIAHEAYASALLLKKRRKMAFSNQNRTAEKLLRTSDGILKNISSPAPKDGHVLGKMDLFQVLCFRLVVLLSLHQLEALGTKEERSVRKSLIDIHTRVMVMADLHDMSKTTAMGPLYNSEERLTQKLRRMSAASA